MSNVQMAAHKGGPLPSGVRRPRLFIRSRASTELDTQGDRGVEQCEGRGIDITSTSGLADITSHQVEHSQRIVMIDFTYSPTSTARWVRVACGSCVDL